MRTYADLAIRFVEMDAHSALMTHAERTAYRRFLAACEERIAYDSVHLAQLRRRLERSASVEEASDTSGRACMYSQVLVRNLASGRTHIETVALPVDAEVATGRRALHSWSGPLLLGAREGEEIRWRWGETLKQWRIEKILVQPTTRTIAVAPSLPAQHRGARSATTDTVHPANL